MFKKVKMIKVALVGAVIQTLGMLGIQFSEQRPKISLVLEPLFFCEHTYLEVENSLNKLHFKLIGYTIFIPMNVFYSA